jgi:hypothetical protein
VAHMRRKGMTSLEEELRLDIFNATAEALSIREKLVVLRGRQATASDLKEQTEVRFQIDQEKTSASWHGGRAFGMLSVLRSLVGEVEVDYDIPYGKGLDALNQIARQWYEPGQDAHEDPVYGSYFLKGGLLNINAWREAVAQNEEDSTEELRELLLLKEE